MIEIYAVRLPDHIEEEHFNNLIERLPEDKQVSAKRFVRTQDALRMLTGEMLTRSAINKSTKIPIGEMVFASNKYGKPYVENVKDVHFNISHSGEWVVCGVDAEPIGIDIQIIKSIKLKIAERFFSQDEYSDIVAKDENERTDYFYDLWTLKESYIKAVGRGLTIPLHTFTIQIGSSGISFKSPSGEDGFYFKQYEIDKLYKLSVCASNKDFPDSVALMSFEEVIMPV